jgi:hypothetical protein
MSSEEAAATKGDDDEDKAEAGQSIQEIMMQLKAIENPSYTATMLKEGYEAQREVSRSCCSSL